MATAANLPGLASLVNTKDEEISVAVRFSGNKNYTVNVKLKDTILDLKEIVAQEAGMSPRSINLVLTGQLLHDSTLIQDCGFGSFTTLHAFCWSDDDLSTGDLCLASAYGDRKKVEIKQEASTNATLAGGESSPREGHLSYQDNVLKLGESDVDGDYFQSRTLSRVGSSILETSNLNRPVFSRFLVYCKLCESVQTGKLRLCCKDCGSGVFLVDRASSIYSQWFYN